MPGPTTKITTREKAAILLAAAGICDDWHEIYMAADEQPTEAIKKQRYLANSVSRWRNSDKVKKTLQEFSDMLADMRAKARQQGQEQERQKKEDKKNGGESERTNEQKPRAQVLEVDYSDPKNQAQKLNELVNTASDPGEALDALKVIISSQKADREAAKERKTVQVYLPLTCDACPLRQKAAAREAKRAEKV